MLCYQISRHLPVTPARVETPTTTFVTSPTIVKEGSRNRRVQDKTSEKVGEEGTSDYVVKSEGTSRSTTPEGRN